MAKKEIVQVELTNGGTRLLRLDSPVYFEKRERWRQVKGFPCYVVSNFGRVMRSRPSYNCHGGISTYVGKILSRTELATGYLSVGLRKGDIQKRIAVHQLVMRAFVGICPAGYEVNHEDGNKKNCRLSNLEYCTKKQNMEHAARTGLTAKGEKHGHAKLTEKDVVRIRECSCYSEATRLVKKLGVSRWSVEDAWYRKTWKHVK